MREDFLHFIWKYGRLQFGELTTSAGETIQLVEVGTHNMLAGPDFFDAKIVIDGQLWAGTVEIHVRSSDWYAHHHEEDPNYNNVILHIVWEDDIAVFRKDNSQIPTVALKEYIPSGILDAYHKLFRQNKNKFINCGKEIGTVGNPIWGNWLERLYFERLERKWNLVSQLLKESQNDWEKVLFIMLAKNFGSKINGDAFFDMARQLDFQMVRKIQDPLQLESVFFGTAGLLSQNIQGDYYYDRLKKEFGYLGAKYKIVGHPGQKPQFFKLRPSNFPTIRLSQLANLYIREQHLFAKIMATQSLEEIYSVLSVSASTYWDDHFTFGKVSGASRKKLTTKFMDLLVINTVLPIKIGYSKFTGNDISEEIINIISVIRPENNSIISKFKELGIGFPSALESQAILQLYHEYCIKNKCLQCVVGHGLLNGKA